MNNFWNRSNKTNGPLFGKSDPPAPPPPPPPSAATPPPTKTPGSNPGLKSTVSNLSAKSSPKLTPITESGVVRAAGFDHDLACGVFVGAFDIPNLGVSVDAVEVTDPVSRRTVRLENWLRTNDMLAILTREYDKARKRLESLPPPPPPAPGRPAASKDYQDAERRVTEVRDQVVCLLHSRRAYHRAKEAGIRILIEV